MKRKIIFDGSCYDYLMRNNGCSVGFNMPAALEGEETFGLPPYAKRMPYLVDEYPACPKGWLRSEGKVKSYFVPVIEGNGMWLDFNENDNKSHHIAIVISIQGINPITGLPCKDAQLEQYIEECPKHKIKFGPDRYCKKCDYKWPKQNYICTTGTPNGYLWLDGFRAANGIVRQYILTAEKMRGVASNIIGKDRVYAIGISFFLSKEKKPIQPNNILRGGDILFCSPVHTPIEWNYYTTCTSDGTEGYYDPSNNTSGTFEFTKGWDDTLSIKGEGEIISCSSASMSNIPKKSFDKRGAMKVAKDMVQPIRHSGTTKKINKHIQTKKIEVGAGAEISQLVYDDPEKLDYWHDDPESIICINYCTEADTKKIVEGGKINISGHPEGFLKDIPVGN